MISSIYSKVSAQTITALVTGAITWVLVTYVFKGNMPVAVSDLLPVLVASVIGFVAGWLKKETHGTPPPVVVPPVPPVTV